MPFRFQAFGRAACAAALLAFLGACTAEDVAQDYPKEGRVNPARDRLESLKGGDETVFGELVIGGPDKPKRPGAGGQGSTVNYYLWRAALETLSLGPLESADPFGGVIITDWFKLDEDPKSQYRVTAYILGRELRTDNIKIALYVRPDGSPNAVAKRASRAAETRLENVILAKARDIRSTQFK